MVVVVPTVVVPVIVIFVLPAVVVAVVMMLDFMRRSVVLDDNRAVVPFMILEVVFPAIDIPHVDFVDMPGARVVEEIVATPFAAFKAGPGVAVSIADSTVVANVGAPVARVKAVMAAFPSPISRGPEHAGCWRPYPRSGGPDVTVRAVCPVAGSPQITGTGAHRLSIDRYRWGSDVDGHDK